VERLFRCPAEPAKVSRADVVLSRGIGGAERSMHWLDVALVIGFALVAFWGARSGLVVQLARFLALVAGLWGSIQFHEPAATLLQETILHDLFPGAVHVLAYGIVFLLIYALLLTASLLLRYGIRATPLRWWDAGLGAVLGVFKAALLLGGLAVVGEYAVPDLIAPLRQRSVLEPWLSTGVRFLWQQTPAPLREEIWRHWQRLWDGIPQNSSADATHRFDEHIPDGHGVARACAALHRCDAIYYLHASDDPAEYSITRSAIPIVQTGIIFEVDIELTGGAVRVTGTRHGDSPSLVGQAVVRLILDRWVDSLFLFQPRQEAASLNDESRHHAMEDGAIVEVFVHISEEILHGKGSLVRV
jgi:uncharacterized membrane protein required for colicin V production